MATASVRPRPATGLLPRALLLAGAVALAVALNLLVAAVAVLAGAPAGYPPLSAPVLALFTVVPMTVGWFGWRFVERRSRRPARTLGVLVAVVFVLSLVPDLVLLATGFIPGTNTVAVVALLLTHVVVMATAVPAYIAASRR